MLPHKLYSINLYAFSSRTWEQLKDALQKSLPPMEVMKSLPEEKLKEVQAKVSPVYTY